nr:T9SS type A sorting domain-containing protein [Aquimarina litoralis]
MALKIYPNPIQGQNLNVFLNMDKMASYEIITISGQLVGQGNVTESIDVSNLKQGIYLLKVFNDNQQITKQFIKK